MSQGRDESMRVVAILSGVTASRCAPRAGEVLMSPGIGGKKGGKRRIEEESEV